MRELERELGLTIDALDAGWWCWTATKGDRLE